MTSAAVVVAVVSPGPAPTADRGRLDPHGIIGEDAGGMGSDVEASSHAKARFAPRAARAATRPRRFLFVMHNKQCSAEGWAAQCRRTGLGRKLERIWARSRASRHLAVGLGVL